MFCRFFIPHSIPNVASNHHWMSKAKPSKPKVGLTSSPPQPVASSPNARKPAPIASAAVSKPIAQSTRPSAVVSPPVVDEEIEDEVEIAEMSSSRPKSFASVVQSGPSTVPAAPLQRKTSDRGSGMRVSQPNAASVRPTPHAPEEVDEIMEDLEFGNIRGFRLDDGGSNSRNHADSEETSIRFEKARPRVAKPSAALMEIDSGENGPAPLKPVPLKRNAPPGTKVQARRRPRGNQVQGLVFTEEAN